MYSKKVFTCNYCPLERHKLQKNRYRTKEAVLIHKRKCKDGFSILFGFFFRFQIFLKKIFSMSSNVFYFLFFNRKNHKKHRLRQKELDPGSVSPLEWEERITYDEEGNRRFKCGRGNCQKTFPEDCLLRSHWKTCGIDKATRPRNHKCKVCDKAFFNIGKVTSWKSWLNHLRSNWQFYF